MRSTRPRKMTTLALGAALTVALAAGCGGDDGAEDTTTTTEAEATTTTEAETTTTVADDDGADADDGGDVEADEDAADVDWRSNAVDHRDRVGRRIGFDCPADGSPGPVWGTGTYTDDSAVCTAAVHAGLITLEDGGRVVIEVAPGQESYEASEANGIPSREYGEWAGSYTFPAADGGAAADDDGIGGDAGDDDGPVGNDAEDDSGIGEPLEDDEG